MKQVMPVLFILCASQANAACNKAHETFLSCTFQNGSKAVDVCVDGNLASYRFGPNGGQAELALTVPLRDVAYTPWPGVGGNIWERVIFTNSDVRYEVYGSISKGVNADGRPSEIYGGIDVFQNDALVATLACDDGSVVFPWTDAFSR